MLKRDKLTAIRYNEINKNKNANKTAIYLIASCKNRNFLFRNSDNKIEMEQIRRYKIINSNPVYARNFSLKINIKKKSQIKTIIIRSVSDFKYFIHKCVYIRFKILLPKIKNNLKLMNIRLKYGTPRITCPIK